MPGRDTLANGDRPSGRRSVGGVTVHDYTCRSVQFNPFVLIGSMNWTLSKFRSPAVFSTQYDYDNRYKDSKILHAYDIVSRFGAHH